jgi:hypothetical protein
LTEHELIQLWNKNRNQIVLAQFAPTFLLTAMVALMQFGLLEQDVLTKLAALLILLASGILGALVQYSAATEAMSVANEIAHLPERSLVSSRVQTLAPWLNVVRFVTPAVFTAIFLVIAIALLASGNY